MSLQGNIAGSLPVSKLLGTGLDCINFKDVPVGRSTYLDIPLTIRSQYVNTIVENSIPATGTPFPGTPVRDFATYSGDYNYRSGVNPEWASHSPFSQSSSSYHGSICNIVVYFTPSRPGYEFATLKVPLSPAQVPGWVGVNCTCSAKARSRKGESAVSALENRRRVRRKGK